MSEEPNPNGIRLVVSDVDGTLVNKERKLTEATIAAVRRLHDAGLHFTISSARPPEGLREFIAVLSITSPVSCFNGAQMVLPDLTPVRALPMQATDVVAAANAITQGGLDLWIFNERGWFVSRIDGPHVEHESSLTGISPQQLLAIEDCTDGALKMVGVSDEYDIVASCEAKLQARTDLHISASRSQKYYLDVTNMNANKGNAVLELSDVLGIPTTEMVTIGDMPTDVFMFRQSGLSIAMGNASEGVKRAATYVTRTNQEDGFAYAMDEFILKRTSRITANL